VGTAGRTARAGRPPGGLLGGQAPRGGQRARGGRPGDSFAAGHRGADSAPVCPLGGKMRSTAGGGPSDGVEEVGAGLIDGGEHGAAQDRSAGDGGGHDAGAGRADARDLGGDPAGEGRAAGQADGAA